MFPRLVVYVCPTHRSATLVLEQEAGGVRLVGPKCCVQMYNQEDRHWRITNTVREAFLEEFGNLVETP